MAEKKSKALINNIFIFGAGTFLTKLVQFALLPLYTIYLSTEAYATGELLNNFSELLFPILTLNIYEAVFRFAMSDEYDDDSLLNVGIRAVSYTHLDVYKRQLYSSPSLAWASGSQRPKALAQGFR